MRFCIYPKFWLAEEHFQVKCKQWKNCSQISTQLYLCSNAKKYDGCPKINKARLREGGGGWENRREGKGSLVWSHVQLQRAVALPLCACCCSAFVPCFMSVTETSARVYTVSSVWSRHCATFMWRFKRSSPIQRLFDGRRAQSWFITGDQAPGKTLRKKNKDLTSMGKPPNKL